MPRSILRRLLVVCGALALLTLGSGTLAHAATLTPPPPTDARCEGGNNRTVCFWTDENFGTPGPVPYGGVTCGGSLVLVNFTGERQFMAVYDQDGALVRLVRHASYSGTLSNPTTGMTVPHEGRFTATDDLQAGTSKITGMLSRTIVPGEGVIWRNIGKIVFSSNGIPFEAGEHDFFAFVAGDASVAERLCVALS